MKRLTILLAFSLAIAACSGESTDAEGSTTTEVATTQATNSTAAPTDSSTTVVVLTTEAPDNETSFAPLFDSFEGAAALDVTVEGTTRPTFSWSSAAGAVRYLAVVADTDGEVLWSWAGDTVSVTVGAGATDRSGLGAVLIRPGFLQVVGFNSDDAVVSASGLVPVG